ncbi:hypothetical protein [Winogradskyella sp. UBA3174]|uniref:hypothetical protein n=1 Tax=Winogradskyella sp. UBA3174 TaxID=1947785 RepID=UPI0025FCA450|nr:hypothetical protein [Winogradskyella sp. UBA3174]
MKFLKRVFDFYLNSSIHVALSAFALTWLTLIQYNLSYDKNVLYFVFFASITGYNFVKYFGVAKFHHRSLASWLKVIQVFSLLAFLIMCYYLFQLKLLTLLYIGSLGIVTFLYAIPFIPKKYLFDEQQNLREIGGLKVYVIALVWMFTTVILPLVENEVTINTDVILTSVQRFCFVIVLMLPFEIRDLNYDNLKLATIPQRIGLKRTKILGVLLLMLFFMLEYLRDEFSSASIVSTLLIVFIALLFLVFSNKNQSKYYSAFFVESLPILWLIVLQLFS